MKKIVISTLPSDNRSVKRLYPVNGNTSIQVDVPVYFAVNSALANNLEKDDDVKVILLGTTREGDALQANVTKFMDDLVGSIFTRLLVIDSPLVIGE